jgi:hypothetical protein
VLRPGEVDPDTGNRRYRPEQIAGLASGSLKYVCITHRLVAMGQTVETKLKIESWDEQPTSEFADGTKISHADVVLTGEGDVAAGRSQSLLFYRPDGTSTFLALLRIEATLSGRRGAFVLAGPGSYDGTTARQQLAIVEGSGSDGLEGISGAAISESTHQDYPYMPLHLDYELM